VALGRLLLRGVRLACVIMSLPSQVPRLSEGQYLQIERRADFKSEFFDGEMFARAGGSRAHSLIAANLVRELGNRLKGRPCVVFNSDLRVKVEATGLLTYPDLSVVCGPERFLEEDTLLNPVLLAEVLSESTEAYDRGLKFGHYRQIPSLREYLLVSQTEARIEQFVRQDSGHWVLRDAVGLEAALELPSLNITLALAEAFANVQWIPAPLRASTPPRR
jgi:Uma2 family endonuclease